MGVRSGSRAACGTKGAVPRAPAMFLAFQTEPKLSKSEVQERSSSKWAPGRFKGPFRTQNCKTTHPLLGAVSDSKRDPRTRCALRGLLDRKLLQKGSKNDPWKTWETVLSPRRELTLMTDPKTILFWSLSSEPSGDPSWEPLWRILSPKGTPKGIQKEVQNETPIFGQFLVKGRRQRRAHQRV